MEIVLIQVSDISRITPLSKNYMVLVISYVFDSVCHVTVTFRALNFTYLNFLEAFVTHCYECHIYEICHQCWQP